MKICGITRPEDARQAEEAGADAIGVVLFSDSPRCVTSERAQQIFSAVGPFIATVAVTHTKSRKELNRILGLRPSAIQISHAFNFPVRPGAAVLRVVRQGRTPPSEADALVVDQSMGTGTLYDRGFARELVRGSPVPVILAGGLTPENVAEAVRSVRPYAVDVASGVEIRPGIKDPFRIEAFIHAAREALR
ncbi:MAG TPA: phosphoribosylanthranilate isomerase [Methanomicrobiales archaeon]|nr:phosphoribosylanthranilate isomerase [Methanomicrobiales archaeon]